MSKTKKIFKKLIKKITLESIIKTGLLLIALIAIFITNQITSVFIIILIALYFFTTELIPVDITALLIMLLVIISGLVSPTEGFSGFSNQATIAVLSMFILSAGIEKTGIINKIGHLLSKYAGKSYTKQLILIALIVGPISGFLNNTAAVAIFIPMILHLAKSSKTPATKLLIPLSFISMSAGTLTLIGTSTNILASETLAKNGFETFGMFEFTHIGIVVLLISVIYFLTIGRLLLPSRENKNTNNQEDDLLPDDFVATIKIEKNSKLIEKTIKEIGFNSKFGLKVLKIIKNENAYVKNIENKKIKENDLLVISGDEHRIIEFDKKENEPLVSINNPKQKLNSGKIIKIAIKSGNLFKNKTISKINFWKKHLISVIGIHRLELKPGHIGNIALKNGEVLLIKTSASNLKKLQKSKDFIILEEIEQEYNESKTFYALGIILFVVLIAALNILPIAVSALLGVLLMFITKCLEADEVYEAVNWDVIFLLAGIIPLGIALQKSGGADLIANLITEYSSVLSPFFILITFYLITTVLTEIISNNAAVVLLIPIGISVAENLALNPIAFVLIVMFAASTSFLTPVGYQTNTMVYGVGNYKFSDFIKVGAPLNLILLFVTTGLIYYFFGV